MGWSIENNTTWLPLYIIAIALKVVAVVAAAISLGFGGLLSILLGAAATAKVAVHTHQSHALWPVTGVLVVVICGLLLACAAAVAHLTPWIYWGWSLGAPLRWPATEWPLIFVPVSLATLIFVVSGLYALFGK